MTGEKREERRFTESPDAQMAHEAVRRLGWAAAAGTANRTQLAVLAELAVVVV